MLFGILYNVFEAVATNAASAGALHSLLQGFGVAAFLVAVLVCPPVVLVAVVALIVLSIRNRRRPTQGRDTLV